MQRGEPQDALRVLDAYERTFPASALGVEASVLRVDALVGAGDQGAAVALARRILAAAPGSPHAPHLRAVIERSNDTIP
jgi:hypothetical protein